jgi:hypothetical protein
MRENSKETEDGRFRDKRYKRDEEDIKKQCKGKDDEVRGRKNKISR